MIKKNIDNISPVKSLNKRLNKVDIVQLANESPPFNDLVLLAASMEEKTAFRAAWLLEKACCLHPAKLEPFAPMFFNCLYGLQNKSSQRHFTKIIVHLTGPGAPEVARDVMKHADLEKIAELFFKWLIDPTTPVAVKANCIEALSNLIPQVRWIKTELPETIDFLIGKESVAFYARAKKIKQRILNA